MKLDSFATLPVGWHYGDGGPIAREIIERSKALYRDLIVLGFTQTDAFPGFDGEIRLTAYNLPHYLQIDLHLDGRYSYVHEYGREERSARPAITLGELKAALRKIRAEEWTTFEPSTQDIMTGELNGFHAHAP